MIEYKFWVLRPKHEPYIFLKGEIDTGSSYSLKFFSINNATNTVVIRDLSN